MLDNVQIAILTKVNELADRFGLKPYDFVAVIDNNNQDPFTVLRYEVPVTGPSTKAAKFGKMLDLIGFSQTTHELRGTDEQIINALDYALHFAPKKRMR